MTHVATAVLEVTSPKSAKTPLVVTNRATELRLQKQRSQIAVSEKTQNNNVVTWRVQKTVSVTSSTLPKTTQNNANRRVIQRNNTFTQSKNVNENIRSKMAAFEQPNAAGVAKLSEVKPKSNGFSATKGVKINGERNNNEANAKNEEIIIRNNVKQFHNAYQKSLEREVQRSANVNSKTDEPVVLVKKGEENNASSVSKTEQKYRTVNISSRSPVVSISVRPWTSSGHVVTDAESKEVKEILEKRRKLIDQSIGNSEPVSRTEAESTKPEITVELRPVSLDPVDASIRESSGASLDVNFPKAIDLARHQQKPLWRDIRGVQETNALESLTKEGRIRQEAKFELMLSEASYLHNLNMLKGHYMHNIHKHIPQVLTKDDYDVLFKYVLGVRSCSEAFLEDLDGVWQEDSMLDGIYDVIQTHTQEKFSPYVAYCRNMLDMSNHLAHLIATNQPFKTLLEVLINREGAQRLTLDAFLTSPMQRITKLPLLMKTIMDKCEEGSAEHKKCSAAYDAAYKIALECDTVVNEKKRMEELLRLSQEVEFGDECRGIPVVAPNRHLISRANVKHFAFRDKAPKREKLQLILLSDLLLVTKRKSDKLYIVVDHCSKDQLIVKEVENPTLYGEAANNKQLKPVVITLLCNSQEKKLDLVVTFKDQSQCKEWLQMFAVSEEDEAAETAQQVVALQEHEAENEQQLTLSPGMVIEITGPEVDGWCEGEVLSDGSKGLFPVAKTTKIITSSKPKSAKSKNSLRSSQDLDKKPDEADDLKKLPESTKDAEEKQPVAVDNGNGNASDGQETSDTSSSE